MELLGVSQLAWKHSLIGWNQIVVQKMEWKLCGREVSWSNFYSMNQSLFATFMLPCSYLFMRQIHLQLFQLLDMQCGHTSRLYMCSIIMALVSFSLDCCFNLHFTAYLSPSLITILALGVAAVALTF